MKFWYKLNYVLTSNIGSWVLIFGSCCRWITSSRRIAFASSSKWKGILREWRGTFRRRWHKWHRTSSCDRWKFPAWLSPRRRRDLRVSEDDGRRRYPRYPGVYQERVSGVGNGGHISCHFGTFVSDQGHLWKWQLWWQSFWCFYRVLLSWLWNYNYSTEKMAFHFPATKLGRFQHSNNCASKSWSEILSNCKDGSLCECRIGQLATFCLTFDRSQSNFHCPEGRWHFGMCRSPLWLHGDRVLSFVHSTQGDLERLRRRKCPGHLDGHLRRFRGTETHRSHGLGGLEDHLVLRPALGTTKLTKYDKKLRKCDKKWSKTNFSKFRFFFVKKNVRPQAVKRSKPEPRTLWNAAILSHMGHMCFFRCGVSHLRFHFPYTNGEKQWEGLNFGAISFNFSLDAPGISWHICSLEKRECDNSDHSTC